MYIERIQVEEGFLSGLDLEFDPHFNVLIGARGTGKTSIVELIRFCLGAPAFTELAGTQAQEQARSVLSGGRVTVTLREANDRLVVSRSIGDEAPQATGSYYRPTVIAQREVEAIGAQPGGRVTLLDQFRTDAPEIEGRARQVVRDLRSLTAEISALSTELQTLNEQAAQLAAVPEQLAAASAEQTTLLATVALTQAEQQRLGSLQQELSVLNIRQKTLSDSTLAIEAYAEAIERVASNPPEMVWPDAAGPNLTVATNEALRSLTTQLSSLGAKVLELGVETRRLTDSNAQARLAADQESRALRAKLDELQAGAAEITRTVANLTERQGELAAVRELIASRAAVRDLRKQQRDALYEELDSLREQRFQSRRSAASAINAVLGPAIRVSVTKSLDVSAYANAIAAALRGSGLQYNRLAGQIADSMSPLEFVSAVEEADFASIAAITSIAPERAATAIASTRASGTSDIIAASIGDGVQMELLDGQQYKGTDEMSIGQRCTVILPVVLEAHAKVLLMDQPEDNLDNAFITSTLIKAINERHTDDQIIIASHNANLPVLGEAERVILLASDGRRGFVRHAGPLDDPGTVHAVTTVMEGGLEAFRQRSRFYNSVLPDPEG
jgi:ABC-type Fe3+/spermidine/putrescine transport system ATPase subunit